MPRFTRTPSFEDRVMPRNSKPNQESTDYTEGETLAILPDSVWSGYSVVFQPR